jgi:dephospho-CoA kinase
VSARPFRRPLLVGLTGGIASGKSTATRAFTSLGVKVVDTDLIARDVVAPGTDGLAEVVAAFGTQVLDTDGALDRRALRERVFASVDDRRRLEAILHPRIRARALADAIAASGPYVIVVVPLLVETGFDRLVDRVVVVDVPEQVQRERLIARDGHDERQAAAALATQTDRQSRLRVADHVLDNAGDTEHLRQQVRALHRTLQAEAERDPRADSP